MSLSRQFDHNGKLYYDRDCRPIVFIDSRLQDYNRIVQQISPEVRAIIVGSLSDGVRDITDILSSSCCPEVHLMCLGSPGCLYLGNSELSLSTLDRYRSRLKSWFFNIAYSCNLIFPRLSLYGSNVAGGDVGEEFITKLSQITEAEITASVSLNNSDFYDRA